MKKFTYLFLTLFMFIGRGSAWAGDPVEITISDYSSELSSNYEYVIEKNGVSVSFDKGGSQNVPTYNSKGRHMRLYYGGSSMTVSSSKNINSIEILLGDSKSFPTTGSVTTGTLGAATNKVQTWTVGDTPTNTVKITNSATGSNTVQIVSLKISLEESGDELPVPEMSFDISKVTYIKGNAFSEPVLTTNPSNLAVKYSSSDETVATVNQNTGKVTYVSYGTTMIRADFEGNESYDAAHASYTLTCVDSNVDQLNIGLIGVTGSSYTTFSNIEDNTGAKYAGKVAKGNNGIQLNATATNCIVSTYSTKYVNKIKVKWNSSTASGRTLNIYYKDAPYTETDAANTGSAYPEKIVCGTSTEANLTGLHKYIGLAVTGGAAYFDEIAIEYIDGDEVIIGETGYATYYNSEHGFIMPTDCGGFIAANDLFFFFNDDIDPEELSSRFVPWYPSNNPVPADEPIIIVSETPGVKVLVHTEAENSLSANGMNDLHGTDAAEETKAYIYDDTELEWTEASADDYYFYGLSYNTGDLESVGFYWMNEGGAPFTNGAHKVYLTLPKSAGAKKQILFNDKGTTAINNVVNTAKTLKNEVYNLAGQKVDSNYKGIVIINGKKHLNK